MIPVQKHSSAKKGRKPSSDKSKPAMASKQSHAGPQGSASVAKKPKGTPIAAPGGRNSRSNTFGGS